MKKQIANLIQAHVGPLVKNRIVTETTGPFWPARLGQRHITLGQVDAVLEMLDTDEELGQDILDVASLLVAELATVAENRRKQQARRDLQEQLKARVGHSATDPSTLPTEIEGDGSAPSEDSQKRGHSSTEGSGLPTAPEVPGGSTPTNLHLQNDGEVDKKNGESANTLNSGAVDDSISGGTGDDKTDASEETNPGAKGDDTVEAASGAPDPADAVQTPGGDVKDPAAEAQPQSIKKAGTKAKGKK